MDANAAMVHKPSQRLSVATTIADDDVFPDFSDPNLFSGDRDGDRGAGSLTDRSSELFESISPTVSVSSSSNSPIMPGEQHAALSGGKLLLPIPTNSGNSSQSSFAMSEVDESEGSGFENLPPEVASADISISGAPSFAIFTSRSTFLTSLSSSSARVLGYSGWQFCRDDVGGCRARAEATVRPASGREQGRAIPIHYHCAHQSARKASISSRVSCILNHTLT